jgi:hypothetical protein
MLGTLQSRPTARQFGRFAVVISPNMRLGARRKRAVSPEQVEPLRQNHRAEPSSESERLMRGGASAVARRSGPLQPSAGPSACFVEPVEEAGGLPTFARKGFDGHPNCRIFEHGSLRLDCVVCVHDRQVGLGRKRRGFCPSCLGRRVTG